MKDRILRRSPQEVQAREKRNLNFREARIVVNRFKTELAAQGSNGILYIEDDEVWMPPRYAREGEKRPFSAKGKEITLLWDLRPCESSITNRSGWESKSIDVGVLDDGEVIVSFSTRKGKGFSQKQWLEESPRYLQLLAIRKKAAASREDQSEEGEAITLEPSLEDRIRYAMEFAQYVSDGRYTRD